MPDPTTFAYFGLPGYQVLWLLTLLSFSVFGARVLQHVRILAQARPDPRWDHLGQRSLRVVREVLFQRRLLDEPLIGIAHLLIFWSFVLFATTFFWGLLRGLIPTLPISYPDDVGWIALAMELFAMLGLAALCVAAVRRYGFTPEALERSGDATTILILIAVVLGSFLALSGFRVLTQASEQAWRPVGGLLANGLLAAGVTREVGPNWYLGMWWLHMATVLGFLAYLPFSKHLHLLASPFAVFFSSLDARRLPRHSEGATRLPEFTWRELFSGLACAECGRCDRACPAFQSGLALDPKDLIRKVKEAVIASEGSAIADGHALLGEVRSDQVWACTTCAACMERCPVFNEHIPLLVEMRRALVLSGECPPRLQEVLLSLERYGNSFGQAPRARPKWCNSLNGWLKDARKEAVDYLWFTGDYASYDPRVQPATRALARILQRADLNVGLLHEAEHNAGNDVRRVGEEGLFELLVEKNLAAFHSARFKRVLTADPHSYHALKHEYPPLNGSRNVVHHTELIDGLLQSGQLAVHHELLRRVTYHDPCYLGRYNGVYAAPRDVLDRIGAELVEMPRNRSNAYCCGAGGGRIWMEDAPVHKERPAESRVREAAQLPGVEMIVVSCPKDLVMFQDALKTTGLENHLIVREIAELVEGAVTP